MNLFRKVVASVTLAALVVSTGATGVSAYSNDELAAANGLAAAGVINDNAANPAGYNFASTIMRNEASKVAVNLDGEVSMKNTCDNSFADVSATTPNDWTCGYAEALLDAGKVSANANFNPLSNLTKAEATKMMLEAAGCTDVYTNADKWQAETVAFAAENDIVSSFTDYNTPATRAFVFAVAYNAMNSCPVAEVSCDETMSALGLCELEKEEVKTEETKKETKVETSASNEGASVSISPETPVDGNVAANIPRTALLAFDVTAGDEDLTLDEVSLKYTGLSNSTNIEKLAVYLGNDKITKGSDKRFDNENIRDLSFEKNTVIKAGETKTLFLTATLNGGYTNESHQVTIVSLSTKAGDLAGAPLVGAILNPIYVSNNGKLKLTNDTASETITIGEEVKLAGFNLEETSKKEDVVVKSVTFTVSGSIDSEDDLADLRVLADGVEIASNLTADNDEIIADLNYTIEAGEEIEFELRGTVTGGVNNTIEMTFASASEDIYAVGSTTGVAVGLLYTAGSDDNIADVQTIEGSEINVSLDKSDIDDAKPNADKVLVGTLKVSTDISDYTVNKLTVTVKNTSTSNFIANIVKDLELDGSSYDSVVNEASTGATYTFQDIDLVDGDLNLPITFDVVDSTLINGTDLEFEVKFVEIEDNDQNIKYTSNLNTILSSNSFDKKTISVNTSTFTISATKVNKREVVLGNSVETVIYKGKINVGDADSVKIKNIKLNTANGSGYTLSNSANLKDILDTVTLNIGGQTFDGDINASDVRFTNINSVVAAGSDNVEVLVTALLKDSDKIANNDILSLGLDVSALELRDSSNEKLVSGNISVSDKTKVITTLLDKGTFAITIQNDPDTDDNLENTVLAGDSFVTLAELELEAEYEDAKVKEIAFDFGYGSIDLSNTLSNVKLVNVNDNSTIVDGGIVTYGSGITTVIFKNDFVISDSDNLVKAELVADINDITGKGGQTSAEAGRFQLANIRADKADIKGVQSNDELTAGGNLSTLNAEEITIVPTVLKFSVIEHLSNGSAKIKITANSGNNTVGTNDQIPEVSLDDLVFSELGNNTDGYKLYKDGQAGKVITATPTGNKVVFDMTKGIDNVFDTSATYIIVPQGTTDKTYSLVLSGDVSTYRVNTVPVTTGLDTVLNSDITVGSKTY